MGYEAQPIRLISDKYGTCQIRVRLFIVALLVECPWWRMRESSEFDAVFANILSRLQALQVQAPSLRECMMASDDPVVLAELEHCKRKAEVRKPDKTAKWKMDMMSFCQKHPSLRWGNIKAAPSSTTSPWFPTLPERDQTIIGAMQFLHGEFVCVDTSQSLELVKYVCPPASHSLASCQTVLGGCRSQSPMNTQLLPDPFLDGR